MPCMPGQGHWGSVSPVLGHYVGVHGVVDPRVVLVRRHDPWGHKQDVSARRCQSLALGMGPPDPAASSPRRWYFSSSGLHTTRLHQNSATALTTAQPPSSWKSCRSWGGQGGVGRDERGCFVQRNEEVGAPGCSGSRAGRPAPQPHPRGSPGSRRCPQGRLPYQSWHSPRQTWLPVGGQQAWPGVGWAPMSLC